MDIVTKNKTTNTGGKVLAYDGDELVFLQGKCIEH